MIKSHIVSHVLAVQLLCILFCSCTGRKIHTNVDLPITLCDTSVTDTLTVHKKQPFIRQNFNPKSWPWPKEILVIQILELKNPNQEPLTFMVSIELPNETIALGTFSLFPPDEPGIFRFRTSEHISAIEKWISGAVIIKLIPQEDQSVSRRVNVKFNQIRWE